MDKKLKLKLHPMQDVVDDNGVTRFRENKIVRVLLDTGKLDMTALARMDFPQEDRIQLAQLIGYSVGGFAELSYVTDDAYEAAMAKTRLFKKGKK